MIDLRCDIEMFLIHLPIVLPTSVSMSAKIA